MSNAAVQSSGDGSAYAESVADSGQSRAITAAGRASASPFNPFNEELGPYIPPGPSFSEAEAQAINSDSYGQGLISYPYPGSYPYSAGLNSPQELADNRLYQPSLNANPQSDGGNYQRDPAYNHYGQGLIPAQAQNQADNGFYQPGYSGPLNVSPYNQGSSFPQVPGQGDSESNNPIIEPKSMLPNTAPASDSHSAFPSSYSYTPESGPSSAYKQDNSGPYQRISAPNPDFSPYDRFLVPYKGPSSTHTHVDSEEYQPVPIIKSKEDRYETNSRPYSQGPNSHYSYSQKEQYQAIPLPDSNPSPYDLYLVPYRDPNPPQKQIDIEEYQPIPIPKPSKKQQEALAGLYSERFSTLHSNSRIHNSAQPQSPADRTLYQAISLPNSASNNPYMIPYMESSYSQKENNNGAYQPVPIPKNSLRTKPTQDEINPYQSIPVPDSDLSSNESSMAHFKEQNSQKLKLQDESNENVLHHSNTNANDPKSDATLSSTYTDAARTREYNPVVDDIDLNADLISKGGWDPYEYNPYTPSGAYPRLYPSGAEAAQTNADNKPGVSNAYSQGIGPHASVYPSESPVPPGGPNPVKNETQGPPNVLARK